MSNGRSTLSESLPQKAANIMMVVNLKLNSNGGIQFFGYFSMLINTVMGKKGETLKFAKVLLLLLFDSLGHDCTYKGYS